MSVTELMFDLRERGIQLEVRGDRLRYSPKAAMTPELAQRMKAHKVALLAILTADDIPAAALWQTALDSLEGDPEFPPEMLEVYRRASVRWEGERPAGDCVNEPTEEAIDPNAPQCSKCGSIDFRDTLVHEDRSTRRDCARCGRFIDFPRWYENGRTESLQGSVTIHPRTKYPRHDNALDGQPEPQNRAGQNNQY